MKRLFVLGLFAVTVTACTATGTPTGATGPAIPSPSKAPSSPPATPTPSPTPSPVPTLEGERQTYTTKSFAVSFILPAGWARETEEENIIGLTGPNGTIDIETVDSAIDPNDASESADIGPTVDDFVTWLREHPHLESTVPIPVTAAGHSGQQLDVALKFVGTYEPRPLCGSDRCLALVRVTETGTMADHISVVEGQRDRFIVLDVDGLRMQLDVYPKQVDDFESFMVEAQPVIAALAIDRVP